MQDRAYGLFEVKSFDEHERVITGIASSISVDRMGDIVEPRGAKYALPMPLLFQHKHDQPVGWVEFAESGDKDIKFRARLAKIEDAGPLKTIVDTAWQAVKAKLVRGVSIGFRSIEHEFMKDSNGIRFKQWEWLELSIVTVPAHQDASIHTIRSIDSDLLAASGKRGIASSKPGVSGPTLPKHKETRAMKTIAEQIASFEAKRAADMARMEELMSGAAEKGETLDETQESEYDGLQTEVEQIDKHLVRLRGLDAVNKAKAIEIANVTDTESGSKARGGFAPVSVKANVPKGTAFTRYVIAIAAARGSKSEAIEIAKARWGDQTPEVVLALKGAIAAGTTTDSTWAAPLTPYNVMASEFVELLYPATIIGRIPGLRRVPFNIQMPRETGGSSFGWVGEAAPKPLSQLSFDTITLRWAKAAGIVVLTEELIRFSNPSAEAIVQNDLVKACAKFLDHEFLDPDKAEVTNVSPAGITAGITPVQASGTTFSAIEADLLKLMAPMIAANLNFSSAVFVMSTTQAMALSLMQNALGQTQFPNFRITEGVGNWFGIPVILSENVATGQITLIIANEVFLADDGGVAIDVSREASVQMDSAPADPTVASTVMVSLWQRNMVGLRAERFINWKLRRSTAVGYIANAGYGGAPGGSGT